MLLKIFLQILFGGGVPARFIGRIEELIEKRKYVSAVGNEEVWEDFKKQRSNDSFSK